MFYRKSEIFPLWTNISEMYQAINVSLNVFPFGLLHLNIDKLTNWHLSIIIYHVC